MLKLCMRVWMLLSSSTLYRGMCLVVCLSMVSQSIVSYDGKSVEVDVTYLKMVLKKVLRSRVGVESKRKIRSILKSDAAEIEAREVLDLIPVIRQYLDQKINKSGGRPATKVQIRTLAYLSALKNALESVGFNEPKYRSFSKRFSDEVDQMFEQLPHHYSILAIRAPNFGTDGQGSHTISGKQLLPCLNFALEKADTVYDQLLTIESKVDALELAGEEACSKLDVIIVDEQTLDSSIDLTDSKLDTIDTTLGSIDSNLGTLESFIDVFSVLNPKADSIVNETSAIDDIAADVDMTFETILSKVDALDNAIDTIDSTISKIDVIALKSDQNHDDACDILARLNALLAPNGSLDQIDSCIDVIKSDIDVVIAVLSP